MHSRENQIIFKFLSEIWFQIFHNHGVSQKNTKHLKIVWSLVRIYILIVQAHFSKIQFIKATCKNLGFNTVLLICKVC
jgi:hypothetical protein